MVFFFLSFFLSFVDCKLNRVGIPLYQAMVPGTIYGAFLRDPMPRRKGYADKVYITHGYYSKFIIIYKHFLVFKSLLSFFFEEKKNKFLLITSDILKFKMKRQHTVGVREFEGHQFDVVQNLHAARILLRDGSRDISGLSLLSRSQHGHHYKIRFAFEEDCGQSSHGFVP